VLTSRSFRWSGRDVTVFILGASHAVRIERGGDAVTELLSCAPVKADESVLREAAVDEPEPICACLYGLAIQSCISLTEISRSPAALRMDCSGSLSRAYPNRADGPSPLTQVGWRIDGDRLCVETLHTYPEEGRMVRTTTIFEEERP
jgi:hypothetical protein